MKFLNVAASLLLCIALSCGSLRASPLAGGTSIESESTTLSSLRGIDGGNLVASSGPASRSYNHGVRKLKSEVTTKKKKCKRPARSPTPAPIPTPSPKTPSPDSYPSQPSPAPTSSAPAGGNTGMKPRSVDTPSPTPKSSPSNHRSILDENYFKSHQVVPYYIAKHGERFTKSRQDILTADDKDRINNEWIKKCKSPIVACMFTAGVGVANGKVCKHPDVGTHCHGTLRIGNTIEEGNENAMVAIKHIQVFDHLYVRGFGHKSPLTKHTCDCAENLPKVTRCDISILKHEYLWRDKAPLKDPETKSPEAEKTNFIDGYNGINDLWQALRFMFQDTRVPKEMLKWYLKPEYASEIPAKIDPLVHIRDNILDPQCTQSY